MKAAQRSRKVDNPLLKSTVAPSASPPEKKESSQSGPAPETQSSTPDLEDTAEEMGDLSSEEEIVSVLEIISDLEEQLDATFAVRETQEQELAVLRPKVEEADLTIARLEGKAAGLEAALASQEEMKSQLEFFEEAQLASSERIRSMQRELKEKSATIKELELRDQAHAAELEARDTRIEQLELENKSFRTGIMDLQNQVSLLQLEPADLQEKIDDLEKELAATVTDRDKIKKDLAKRNGSMAEIRQMLTETRAKARKHYYKKREKPAK